MSSAETCRGLLAAACLSLLATVAPAQSLSDITVVPQRGQGAELARRDRYECHNWAVAETGGVPATGPSREEVERERRAARTNRIITGAGVGAAVGGIVRGTRDHRDAAEGALAGGILGAIAGAAAKPRGEAPEDEAFMAFFRALDACMSARGYAISLPAPG